MSFLLLGNQRSGTNYVLDMINQHPEIETINEPFSMHLDFFRMDEEKWTADDVDPQYLHQKLRMLSQTQKYITDLNLWLNAPYPLLRGFKEAALFEKFDWLQSVVHIDKTVLIIRDPRAIVNSVMKRNMQHSFWNSQQRISDYWGY